MVQHPLLLRISRRDHPAGFSILNLRHGHMSVNESKTSPTTQAFEAKANKVKNLLKGELKRREITYAPLAAKLADIGVQGTGLNPNNMISRGGFTAAFLVQCLRTTGVQVSRLDDV